MEMLLQRDGPMTEVERAAFAFFERQVDREGGGSRAVGEALPVTARDREATELLCAEYLGW